MSNIEIKDLSFSYGSQSVFVEADVNVDEDWHLGLVGRNGRGKTTLLKILQGKLPVSSKIHSAKNFVYFPQEVVDSSNVTLFLLQDLADFEQWQLERELTLLSVDLDVLWRPFESLSGGEQTKCLLALLFLDDSNFPLIDEPTNHLDLPSRKIVANYLKKKSGFIVVSHDREFLNQITDHTLAIEKTQLTLYQGNFSTYELEKGRRDEFERAEDAKLRKSISRLKETARNKANWAYSREGDIHGNPHVKGSGGTGHDGTITARAARVMKKSKVLEKRMDQEITEKEKLLKNLEFVDPLVMRFQPDYRKTLIRFEKFSLGYQHQLFQPITQELQQGEIMALIGANGTGKTSLAQALEDKFTGQIFGELSISRGITISRVRQIFQNRGTLKEFAQREKLDYELFLSNLRKLGMEREVFQQPIERMSQGQQKKVELAKSLSQEAQLYIWDEPLNYLDVFNQEQIVKLLKSVKPTMILIEHDQSFIREVADKIVELHKI
ncbi:MAG: ATP-binding cassette domain-containing protein [Streptococcaceae bacterium]|nr:ATP-binding cassette domain-containing protein [Streptococcaceae bacterium]